MKVANTRIYDIAETIVASGFPKNDRSIIDNFEEEVRAVSMYLKYRDHNIASGKNKDLIIRGEKHIKRIKTLGKTGANSGHCNFLSGFLVSFNVFYTQTWSMQAQRYHFLQIVSSASKMHRLTQMNLDKLNCSNEVKTLLKTEIAKYNEMVRLEENIDGIKEQFEVVINNCPMGLELWMRVTTNYLQLKTIYAQRRYHKTKAWRIFCKWIASLPYFLEFAWQKKDE